MDLVAGPQGSGKSTFFPVSGRGHDAFNIDDHRKKLNDGSSQNISVAIQKKATADYEAFVEGHIRKKTSFSMEVTLAKEITFDQARRARRAGLAVHLTYIAANLADCIERMANRIELGGHGVKLSVLENTYAVSMGNLKRAIREFDIVLVYDNSGRAQPEDAFDGSMPRHVMEAAAGAITCKAPNMPRWLTAALHG